LSWRINRIGSGGGNREARATSTPDPNIRRPAWAKVTGTFGTTATCPFGTTRSAPSALQTSDHLGAIIALVMQEHLNDFELRVPAAKVARPDVERDIGKEAR
jgi:hypothetical protein